MKNILLSFIITILFLFDSGLCKENDNDKETAIRFASFRKTSESGVHLLISDKNIALYLQATTTPKNNPFESVDTVTLTGEWSEDLVGGSLIPLFQTRIRTIRQAVIYQNIALQEQGKDSQRSFVPHRSINTIIPKSTPRIVYEFFPNVIDPSKLYHYDKSSPKFLQNLPKDLLHLELCGIKITLEQLYPFLPKSLISLAVENGDRYLTKGTLGSVPVHLKDLTLYYFDQTNVSRLPEFLRSVPRHVLALRLINCGQYLSVSNLNDLIKSVHEEIEVLEFSHDMPYRLLSSSAEKEYDEWTEDQLTLDVTRLTKLRTLNFDGQLLPQRFKVKSAQEVVLFRNESRNPIMVPIAKGQDVSQDQLKLLPDRLKRKLFDYVRQGLGRVITPRTIDNLMQICDVSDCHPETLMTFYEQCHTRGGTSAAMTIVKMCGGFVKDYERKIVGELKSQSPQPAYVAMYMKERSKYQQEAAQYGDKQLATSFSADEVLAIKSFYATVAAQSKDFCNQCRQAIEDLNDDVHKLGDRDKMSNLGSAYNKRIDNIESDISQQFHTSGAIKYSNSVTSIIENVKLRHANMRKLVESGGERARTSPPFDKSKVKELLSKTITEREAEAVQYHQMAENFDASAPG